MSSPNLYVISEMALGHSSSVPPLTSPLEQIMSNTEKFTVDCVGEVSGKTWKGLFTTKLRLSHRDQLRQDEIRRSLLGKDAENASPRAKDAAEAFSFIQASLVEAPSWWASNANGLDLEDDNVVAEVYGEIIKARVAANEKLKAAAEGAKQDLVKLSKDE